MAGKIRKPRGLKKDGTPNIYWQRFKQKLDSVDSVPISDWEVEQVLGYILKRFKDLMGVEWALSYSGSPSKCKEIYCTNRMILALGTEDWNKVKQYIDFVYDKYIIKEKMNVTSLALFFNFKFVSEFKAECRKKKTITRTTELPPELKKVTDSLNISTYGDLVFAKMAIDTDPEDHEEYINLFNKLESVGFKRDILDKLSA